LKPDSLIFDMDGTLWDNVDSYVVVWNRGLTVKGFDKQVTRNELKGLMGKAPDVMLDTIVPGASRERQMELFDEVVAQYQQYVPDMKPRIFEGVYDGLEFLSEKYKILLLSNCEKDGLVNFMNHTRTRPFITDYMEFGQNFKPKEFNMNLLKDRNHLTLPIYVGDTDSDAQSAKKAGLPFVLVTYGFGTTRDYWLKFDSFPELTEYFLGL